MIYEKIKIDERDSKLARLSDIDRINYIYHYKYFL